MNTTFYVAKSLHTIFFRARHHVTFLRETPIIPSKTLHLTYEVFVLLFFFVRLPELDIFISNEILRTL